MVNFKSLFEDIQNSFNVLKFHILVLSKENKELKEQIKKLKLDIDLIVKKVGREVDDLFKRNLKKFFFLFS